MSIKPFSEVVEENAAQEDVVTPFVDRASGGVDIEATYLDNRETKQQESLVLKIIGFLGSFRGVLVMFVLFFMTLLMVDAVATLQDLLSSGSILDIIYLVSLLLLLSALSIVTYKNYKQIIMLKSASRHQRAFYREKEAPSKKMVPMTLELLNGFSKTNEAFDQRANILRERISSSHDYAAIYTELDEEVLDVIDQEAQKRIKVASAQAALSTAISPLAILDAAIIIWRGVRLTKEIATLYGFKPGWISTIVLLKQGAFTIFFVGAAELATEYVNAATESTVVSKLSLSAGEGISNGILLARIGYGVMAACRPLPMRIKRGSFITSMVSSIKDTMTSEKGKR